MTNKVNFDNYTENYNTLLQKRTKFFSVSEEYFAQYKINLIRAQIKYPIARILEYGCGIGRNIGYLRTSFPNAEIVGTDISEASLRIAASEHSGARFEVERPDMDLGHFDLIFVAGVFHHIPPHEREAVARLLAKRLAQEGTLFVFEHNPFNPLTRRIVNSCPYDADAVLLKPSELRRMLGQVALATHSQSYCLYVPPRLARLAQVERYLGWLPLGGQYWVRASHPK